MNINFSVDTSSTHDLLAARTIFNALLAEPVSVVNVNTGSSIKEAVEKAEAVVADIEKVAAPKRTRAAKAAAVIVASDDDAPMALAEEPTPDPAEADEVVVAGVIEDEPGEGITLSALQEIAKGVVVASPAGRDRLKAVLNDHDATRLSDLAVEHYGSVAKALGA